MDISSAHYKRAVQGVRGEGFHTDNVIKFCTECKNCYEIVLSESRMNGVEKRVYNMRWLKDFPSYGKEMKTCPRCLGQATITEVIK